MTPELIVLAKQLVASKAFKWMAGMHAVVPAHDLNRRIVFWGDRVVTVTEDTGAHLRFTLGDDGWTVDVGFVEPTDVVATWRPEAITLWPSPKHWIPDLTDRATAALLAVQAMERGRDFEHFVADEYGPAGWRSEGERPEYATLGEAAARALLAMVKP